MTPIMNVYGVLLELLIAPDFAPGDAYPTDPWAYKQAHALRASKAETFDTLRHSIKLEERVARIERAVALKLEELPCIAEPS